MQPPATISGESDAESVPRSPLILIGASVRAAAQSAQIAGFPVIGIDLFGDTDTIDACQTHHCVSDFEQAVAVTESLPATEIMQVGGFDGENTVFEKLGRRHTVLGPPIDLRERLTQPKYLAELASRSGLLFPKVRRSERFSSGRMVVKDAGQSGGLGVRWANRQSDGGGYLQDWVPGRAYGATLLCDGSRVSLMGVFRSCFTSNGDCPFVYAGSRGPSRLPAPIVQSIRRVGQQLGRDGLTGLCNIDLIVDSHHRGWLLEINPRWSGSSELVERSLRVTGMIGPDESLLALARRSAAGTDSNLCERFGSCESGSRYFIKRIVYARRTLCFQSQCLNHLRQKFATAADIRFHDLPGDGQRITARTPLLTIVASAIEQDDGTKKSPSELGLLVRHCVRTINERLAYGSPRSSA